MSLHLNCNRCDKSIEEGAALVFSPPTEKAFGSSTVRKYHVCVDCWPDLVDFLDESPKPREWRCRKCGATVDMVAFHCQCTQSPSPWEPVDEMMTFTLGVSHLKGSHLIRVPKSLLRKMGSPTPSISELAITEFKELVFPQIESAIKLTPL